MRRGERGLEEGRGMGAGGGDCNSGNHAGEYVVRRCGGKVSLRDTVQAMTQGMYVCKSRDAEVDRRGRIDWGM